MVTEVTTPGPASGRGTRGAGRAERGGLSHHLASGADDGTRWRLWV